MRPCSKNLVISDKVLCGTLLEKLSNFNVIAFASTYLINERKNMSDLVYIHQNKCWTDSKKLAESFEKRHDDVMKKIQGVVNDMQDLDFVERNFAECHDSSDLRDDARQYRYFRITYDAFALVAMGFTGKKALHFKMLYIEEFNRRGSELELRGLPAISTEDLLQRALDNIRAEKEIASKAIRDRGRISSSREASCIAKVGVANKKIRLLETKLDISENWKSVAAWVQEFPQLQAIAEDSKKLGKMFTAMSITSSLGVKKIPDERWGTVNSYSRDSAILLMERFCV